MNTANIITTLEEIAREAEFTNSELLLDATTPSSVYDFSFVNEISQKGKLYRIDQESLKFEAKYLDFLIELAQKPHVKTTQRVIKETARIPEIIRRKLKILSGIQITKKSLKKLNDENEELIRENLEKIKIYISHLRPKAYNIGNDPTSTFFKMAASMKAITILSQRREWRKYTDLKGEDSLAAIAFQRSLTENKATITLSNDHHLRHIITNFYVVSKFLDEHYGRNAAELLVQNPIRVYGLSQENKHEHRLFLDTAKPDKMQTLDEIAQHLGGHTVRKAILAVIPHFDNAFGDYKQNGIHLLMQKLAKYK